MDNQLFKCDNAFAHTPNSNGEWHQLRDHLTNVGELAKKFGDAFGFPDICWLEGILHDIGKYNPDFQAYLRKCADANIDSAKIRKSPHSIYGAAYSMSINEILSIPIAGHHGGLSDLSDTSAKLRNLISDKKNVLDYISKKIVGPIDGKMVLPEWLNCQLSCEFLIRMLFSALVDADWLDTENHYEPRKRAYRAGYAVLEDLWTAFQEDQSRLMGSDALSNNINQTRAEIYTACIDAADGPKGVYRLTVPTGGGKTRSGMGFALKHAIKHNMDRIIVGIPYTSIIDQTAAVYKGIFGDGNVLEHHSSVELPPTKDEDQNESQVRNQLASENWDAPIIVTTTVQLFESLFSNKPSKCRKLHNIVNSVIILDEVQTLPVNLLSPILNVLQELVDHYGVTIVLSTATQPAFSGESPYLKGFVPEPKEIVPTPAKYFQMLKRVEYQINDEPWTWDRVANEMIQSEQSLCVVNSRSDALALFGLLRDDHAYHLSSLMCPAHRKRTLDEIREGLRAGKPCHVVSTQVVEAGVDLDFPVVLRAMGPLDRIVQAAGRCNREGRRANFGRVIVFNPSENKIPRGAYATATSQADQILRLGNRSLDNPSTFDEYFRLLWQNVKLDRENIQNLRTNLCFSQVASRFRIIDDNTDPVIVRYEADGSNDIGKILEHIQKARHITMEEWRILQLYSVNIYHNQFCHYINSRLIEEIIKGLYIWNGKYDSKTGISNDLLDPADLIA